MTPIKDVYANWHHPAQSMTRLQTAGQDAPPTGSVHSEIERKTENYSEF